MNEIITQILTSMDSIIKLTDMQTDTISKLITRIEKLEKEIETLKNN